MNGKSKCKILKDIRKKIAQENDIEYVTSECKFQGECSGTCPKCEAEVRYLEHELAKRKATGRAVAVAGVAAALVVTATGCDMLRPNTPDIAGDVPYYEQPKSQEEWTGEQDGVEQNVLAGRVPDQLEGETTELILTGDVPWPN